MNINERTTREYLFIKFYGNTPVTLFAHVRNMTNLGKTPSTARTQETPPKTPPRQELNIRATFITKYLKNNGHGMNMLVTCTAKTTHTCSGFKSTEQVPTHPQAVVVLAAVVVLMVDNDHSLCSVMCGLIAFSGHPAISSRHILALPWHASQ